jgi:hypothetical protein
MNAIEKNRTQPSAKPVYNSSPGLLTAIPCAAPHRTSPPLSQPPLQQNKTFAFLPLPPTATAMAVEIDTPPAVSPRAGAGAPAFAVRQRRGWRRRMYAPVEEAGQGTAPHAGAAEVDGKENKKPRAALWQGWLRRLVPREYALGRRWKLSGAPSRLAAGLRWKRVSSGLSVRGGCATALLDTVAFRVMYVVEAVVLGLTLSCFFCCCGCQI